MTSRANKQSRIAQQQQQQKLQEQEEQEKEHQQQQIEAATDVNIKSSSIADLNREMKAKQESLTNVIKQIDSNTQQSSYQGGSKLYRPNSFLTTTTTTNNTSNNSSNTTSNTTNSKPGTRGSNNATNQQHQQQPPTKGFNRNNIDYNNKCSTLPISHTAHDLTCYSNDDNFRNAQTLNKNCGLSKSNGKLNKRTFALSPKFKRKIVETITNRVSFNSLLH